VGIDAKAVRTPYMSINRHTYQVISDLGFNFDFSTGFGSSAICCPLFLKPRRLKKTIVIPLTTPPDVGFIYERVSRERIYSVWISKSKPILERRGVLSFLFHPVDYREGPSILKSLLRYISQQDIDINFIKKITSG
jgi:hypothetical protein